MARYTPAETFSGLMSKFTFHYPLSDSTWKQKDTFVDTNRVASNEHWQVSFCSHVKSLSREMIRNWPIKSLTVSVVMAEMVDVALNRVNIILVFHDSDL